VVDSAQHIFAFFASFCGHSMAHVVTLALAHPPIRRPADPPTRPYASMPWFPTNTPCK
jgi:hypothetical protein